MPNICRDSPSRTVTTYQRSERNRSNPKRAVLVNRRHATAYGAMRMIMSMIFVEISNTASRTLISGAVLSAGNRVMAAAMMTAKNIRWIMFGVEDAMAAKGFEGTIVWTICINADGEGRVTAADSTRSPASVPYRAISASAVAGL